MDNLTITQFLTAQYDEAEAAAKEASEEVGDRRWQQRNVRIVTTDDRDREVADYVIADCIPHIIRHDPAHVLADIAAKRRILARHAECGTGVGYCDDGGHGWDDEPGCGDQADLASPYAEHPDYNPDWRP